MRQRRARASIARATTTLRLPSLALRTGLLTMLAAGTATSAGAQRAAGIGEDAFVLPRGSLRITLAPTFENVDERARRDGTSERLGAAVSGSYDASRLGVLAAGQTALRALTGLPDARLTLGNVQVTADQRSAIIPLRVELGLGGRLQVGITVPYVRTVTNAVARTDDQPDADVAGLNPALTTATARTTNSQLVAQLLGAARNRELGAGIGEGGCTGSSVPACALVNETRATAQSVAQLYGTGSDAGLGALADVAGSAAVPRRGTPAADSVDVRLARLRTALGDDASGVTVLAPVHAVTPIAGADLRTFLGDARSGLGLDAFRLVERSHIGDVEASVKLALVDGIGPIGSLPPRALGVRIAVAGVLRAPTGQGEEPGNALDVGAGDGQTDVELRGVTDVTVGRALWFSGAVRIVRQLADDQFVRAPVSALEGALAPSTALVRARRDLGDAMEMELTPRWMPNDFFTVAATYQLRRKGADEYALAKGATAPDGRDVTLLGTDSEFTDHRLGFGFTWSTLGAARRGKRVLPLDVSYLRVQTVRASGGIAPLVATDQLRLRLWFGATRAPAR